jgi:hypothetical protein
MKISIILSSTALVVTILGAAPLGQAALDGPNQAASQAKPSATSKPNVTVRLAEFSVSQDGGGGGDVATGKAVCPAGMRVFGGGYTSTGQHTKYSVAAPARGVNGYIVTAIEPPINIAAGIGRETAKITVEAFCAPAGKPIVLE